MAPDVRRNDDLSRYELYVDGELAVVADFHERDGAVVMPHTETLRRFRRRGLGAVLVKAALDDLRSKGHKVVPSCWFVAQVIDQHPEYADLLA